MYQLPCNKVKKMTPFFEVYKDTKNLTMNEYTFKKFEDLTNVHIDLQNPNAEIDGLDKIPDGMIEISQSNMNIFDYRLQINDYSFFQYHRNNGITKIGVINPSKQKSDFGKDVMEDLGNTTNVMRPSEGAQ